MCNAGKYLLHQLLNQHILATRSGLTFDGRVVGEDLLISLIPSGTIASIHREAGTVLQVERDYRRW